MKIKPDVRQIPRGWLAVSERGSGLRIAVVAGDEPSVRRAFAEALRTWADLLTLPDPYVS